MALDMRRNCFARYRAWPVDVSDTRSFDKLPHAATLRRASRMTKSKIIPVVLFAFVCVIALAESPAPGTSGIEGTVGVSPTRPGPIRKGEPPTALPVRNTPFLVQAGDETVATFTTDGEGHFQVALPPGHYVVSTANAPRVGRWRFEADVAAGQITRVNWTADSGMR